MSKLNRLQLAVINQLGYEEINEECNDKLNDICEHGASAGFTGFIYYSDTVKFFDDNKSDIMELLNNVANDLDLDVLVMISEFGSIKGDFSTYEISLAIEEKDNINEIVVKNLLSWFTLEETARELS